MKNFFKIQLLLICCMVYSLHSENYIFKIKTTTNIIESDIEGRLPALTLISYDYTNSDWSQAGEDIHAVFNGEGCSTYHFVNATAIQTYTNSNAIGSRSLCQSRINFNMDTKPVLPNENFTMEFLYNSANISCNGCQSELNVSNIFRMTNGRSDSSRVANVTFMNNNYYTYVTSNTTWNIRIQTNEENIELYINDTLRFSVPFTSASYNLITSSSKYNPARVSNLVINHSYQEE